MTLAFIITLLAVLLQAILVPLNLAVLLLVLWAVTLPPRRWPVLAFILGLSVDLLSGRPLGLSSLLFILLLAFLWLYSRKWSSSHPLFLFVLVVAGDWLARWLWGLSRVAWEIILVGLIAAIWGWWKKTNEGPVKIKISTGL